MKFSEAIDQIIAYTDNVSPSGADDAERRLRIANMIREEATQTYYAREWTFRLKPTEAPHVVVPANQGWGLLPVDFLMIGKLGAVYNFTQNGSPMYPAVESEITDLLAQSTLLRDSNVYTVFGLAAQTPPLAARKKIWIPYASSDVALQLFYHALMPTLDETAPNDDNLDLAIPTEYQQTVIIPGVRARARRSLGDTRWQDDLADRMAGLQEMFRNNRRGQGGTQQLPSFFGY